MNALNIILIVASMVSGNLSKNYIYDQTGGVSIGHVGSVYYFYKSGNNKTKRKYCKIAKICMDKIKKSNVENFPPVLLHILNPFNEESKEELWVSYESYEGEFQHMDEEVFHFKKPHICITIISNKRNKNFAVEGIGYALDNFDKLIQIRVDLAKKIEDNSLLDKDLDILQILENQEQ